MLSAFVRTSTWVKHVIVKVNWANVLLTREREVHNFSERAHQKADFIKDVTKVVNLHGIFLFGNLSN